jgi:hypothetical protein
VEARLEEFSDKVRNIQEELKSKGSEFKNLQQIFRTETRELSCDLNEREPAATQKELEEIKAASEEKINKLLPRLKGLNLQETEAEKIRIKKKPSMPGSCEPFRKDRSILLLKLAGWILKKKTPSARKRPSAGNQGS